VLELLCDEAGDGTVKLSTSPPRRLEFLTCTDPSAKRTSTHAPIELFVLLRHTCGAGLLSRTTDSPVPSTAIVGVGRGTCSQPNE
jgi:hypothetical protein